MRYLLTALCLISVTACAENPAGPGVRLDEEFTLAPGQIAHIEGTSLRLQFTEVSGDSRCPTDAVCIQGGDAIVHVRASGESAAASSELHTSDSARASAVHGPFRIALLALQPFPFSTRTISQDEYRATLRVTRS
jgi:hypothetical protein